MGLEYLLAATHRWCGLLQKWRRVTEARSLNALCVTFSGDRLL